MCYIHQEWICLLIVVKATLVWYCSLHFSSHLHECLGTGGIWNQPRSSVRRAPSYDAVGNKTIVFDGLITASCYRVSIRRHYSEAKLALNVFTCYKSLLGVDFTDVCQRVYFEYAIFSWNKFSEFRGRRHIFYWSSTTLCSGATDTQRRLPVCAARWVEFRSLYSL